MKLKNSLIIILLIIITLFPHTSYAENVENSNAPISENTISVVDDDDSEESTNTLNLYGESCILVECSTGRTAYEKNADNKMYPASTTKVLTAILAIENCELTDVVTITSEMTSKVPAGYTTAYLKPGETVTVEQLLNALLIPSANDAGFALAIHISGSVEEFSNLMNEKALQLGCTNSHFTNPSGIHDENHYSTARDMALITQCAINYPQITNIVCKTSYTLQPEHSNLRTFNTTNTLIEPTANSYYEYATGFKTGFTDQAGACIIATAKKEDMEFIAVILNAPTAKNNTVYRDLDCKTLFEYGFENYDEIVKVEEPIISFMTKSLSANGSNNSILNLIMIIGILVVIFALILIVLEIHSKKKHKK